MTGASATSPIRSTASGTATCTATGGCRCRSRGTCGRGRFTCPGCCAIAGTCWMYRADRPPAPLATSSNRREFQSRGIMNRRQIMNHLFRRFVPHILLFCAGCLAKGNAAADDLRNRLKDANSAQTDLWVYNDIPKAIAEAKRVNKPLFVTFRCVPCKACAAFDADVANGNERVRDLAKDKFVSVRQVEMKGVDLSQFQFGHDLNWAAMFINADGTVYARYGTQSAEGPDAYNSIDGLINTMNRVLELHAAYPANKPELADKVGKPKPVSSALELPGLRNPEKYARETTRSNCIHCHNIHDAEHAYALSTGKWSIAMMWKYPLPENIGLRVDRTNGVGIREVTPDSAAAQAGVKTGEDIVRMNGQRITSIADMQWVLHNLPEDDTTVTVETSKTGR